MDAKNGEAKKRDAKTRIRPLIADKAHTTIKPQSAMLHPNFFGVKHGGYGVHHRLPDKVEGPRQVRGYVPCNRISDGKGRNYIGAVGVPPCGVQYPATGDPSGFRAMGASGVTVATGCDLGQTDIPTLKAYGLTDEDLLCKLDPYIGLKKSAALQRLFSPASSADSHGSLHPRSGRAWRLSCPLCAACLPERQPRRF